MTNLVTDLVTDLTSNLVTSLVIQDDSYDVTASGGSVKDGESFTAYLGAGVLSGVTAVTINGIACTSVSEADDVVTATAPSDDLMHGVSYTMSFT